MKKKDVQKKKEDLFFTIRDRIYTGYYWPREKLVETALAEEMSVSRTVIRDVLKELSSKELVTIEPHKGTFVAELSYQKIRELVQLEGILEGAAASRATGKLDAEQIRNLHQIMEQAEPLRDPQAWSPYNRNFHRIIISSCGNSKLINLIRENSGFLRYWFIQLAATPEEIEARNKEHREILKLIEKRNPSSVKDAMEKHVLNSVVNLLNKIQTSSPGLVRFEHKTDPWRKEAR